MEALFDIRVIDTNAPSHPTRSLKAILETGANKKKRVYEQAVVERRGNFTPIVLSVNGLLHREAKHFLKRIAANLAHKWEKPYSQMCRYVRSQADLYYQKGNRGEGGGDKICNDIGSAAPSSQPLDWSPACAAAPIWRLCVLYLEVSYPPLECRSYRIALIAQDVQFENKIERTLVVPCSIQSRFAMQQLVMMHGRCSTLL